MQVLKDFFDCQTPDFLHALPPSASPPAPRPAKPANTSSSQDVGYLPAAEHTYTTCIEATGKDAVANPRVLADLQKLARAFYSTVVRPCPDLAAIPWFTYPPLRLLVHDISIAAVSITAPRCRPCVESVIYCDVCHVCYNRDAASRPAWPAE